MTYVITSREDCHSRRCARSGHGAQIADGKWTLEFGRDLITGSEYDVQFEDLESAFYFALATFDNAQVRHAFQQGAMTLTFQP